MNSDIILLISLLGIFWLAHSVLKLMEKKYDIEKLKEEIHKKDTLIRIFNQYTTVEDRSRITDIYRIIIEPNKWIPYSNSFIDLILEEDILVDLKFHDYISEYVKSHPETHKLPGSRRYL